MVGRRRGALPQEQGGGIRRHGSILSGDETQMVIKRMVGLFPDVIRTEGTLSLAARAPLNRPSPKNTTTGLVVMLWVLFS